MAGKLVDTLDRFVVSLKAVKQSPHTVAAYRRDITAVGMHLAALTGTPWEELTLDELTAPNLRHAFAVRAQDSAAATMARTHSSWSRFFRFCRSEGLVEASPMDDVDKVRPGGSRPRSIEVDGLAELMLNAAGAEPPPGATTRWPARDRALVAVLMLTGLRLSELVGLHCQSFNGEPGAYQVDVIGKGSKYRAVPVLDELMAVVNEYQSERRVRFDKQDLALRTTPLWVHIRTGAAITARQVQYLLDRIYREAGVRGRVPEGALVHALRHTFAMDVLDNGASIVEVQSLLGHESIATTRRYLMARPDGLRGAVTATASGAALRSLDPRKPKTSGQSD